MWFMLSASCTETSLTMNHRKRRANGSATRRNIRHGTRAIRRTGERWIGELNAGDEASAVGSDWASSEFRAATTATSTSTPDRTIVIDPFRLLCGAAAS